MPSTTSAPPAPTEPDRRRPASGTVFVVLSASLALAFVLFLIFVSPALLERTLALAPPPAPQTVASGEADGRTWSVTAVDGSAEERGPDEDGIEPIVEEEPCAIVDLGDGSAPTELCVERRGGSLRGIEAVTDDAGRAVVVGIVAPQVTSVELVPAEGAALAVAPSYVDFGFPIGFFAVEVDAGTAIGEVRALDVDGVARATATCDTATPPLQGCETVEGDY